MIWTSKLFWRYCHYDVMNFAPIDHHDQDKARCKIRRASNDLSLQSCCAFLNTEALYNREVSSPVMDIGQFLLENTCWNTYIKQQH